MDKTIREQFCEKVAKASGLDVPTLLKIDEQLRAGLTLEEFLKCTGEFNAALEEAPRRLEGTWHTVLGVQAFTRYVTLCYPSCMIHSFRDKDTEALYNGQRVRRFEAVKVQAERRLQILDSATSLGDLARLPSNRLEARHGDRQGQHSIRINDQWRVCFVWREDGPHEVEMVDYH